MNGKQGPHALIYGSDPLELHVTSYPISCEEPDRRPPFDQCDWYTIEVTFPAAALVAGALDTSHGGINVLNQFSGLPYSSTPGDCPGTGAVTGGAIMPSGFVTFTSVEASTVVAELDGFDAFMIDQYVDGTITATRCR